MLLSLSNQVASACLSTRDLEIAPWMDYSLRAGPRITPKCSRTALFVVLQCCFNQLFGPFLLVLLLVSFSEPAQAAPLFGQEYNSNEYYANSTSQSHLNARAVGGPGQPDLFLIVLIPGSDMYKHLAWLYGAARGNQILQQWLIRLNRCNRSQRRLAFTLPCAMYALLHYLYQPNADLF